MANNYNDTVNLANVIGTTFSNVTIEPLRPNYVFDGLAQERNWNLNSSPIKGDVISFPVLAALSANTGTLVPTGGTITASQKSVYTRRNVSLNLYGDHGVVDMLKFLSHGLAIAC